MDKMQALIIIFAFLLFSLYLGIRSKKGKEMSLEQWSVGGRGFGTIFIFLLMAGEIYTTFTFLGASGWAYGRGGPTYYILGYGALMYVIAYYLLPPIWRYAKEHSLVSQSDFFVKKYNSPMLGVLVAFVGVVAMVPYLVLQLTGLGIIVSETSYGLISSSTAIWLGVFSVTVYVMISGIHASAWISVVKDTLILAVALFLGIYLPYHYYGGIQPMFESVNAAKPGFLALPEKGLSTHWFASTVFLTTLGAWLWPHSFASVFSAKNANVFRRNATIMPVYQLMSVLIFLVGFTAIGQIPGLTGAAADLSLIKLSMKTFDPWVVGIIGAAGLLTALVPGSMILMAASTLLAKNVYKVFVPSVSDEQVAKIAKGLVPFVALIAVYFTLQGGSAIIVLLLMGYSFVTQLAPAVCCSLLKNNPVSKQAAIAGILAGIAVVAYVTITKTTMSTLLPTWPQAVQDCNVGIIALMVNIGVTVLVSLVTKRQPATATEN